MQPRAITALHTISMTRKPLIKICTECFHALRDCIKVYRFLFLFILMMFYFVTKALFPGEHLSYATSLAFLVIILYSLYIISRKVPILWQVGLLMGVMSIVLALLDLLWPSFHLALLIESASLVFYAIMLITCLYFCVEDEVISITSLFGSLCGYLYMGLMFSSWYTVLYYLNDNAFSNISNSPDDDFIYFSFVTLTTLGYGDINPISNLAKTFSWIEAYLGQAYLTVLMALLVGRYLTQHQKERK